MASTDGTALIRFKVAFMALLDNYVAGATYDSPQSAEDMMAQGTGIAAWWADEADAECAVTVVKGAGLWFDEVARPVLRIQSLGLNTGDTQAVVDARASQVLFYALGILAEDPTAALTQDDIEWHGVTDASYKYTSGILGTNGRAAGFEVTFDVRARLKLDIP